MIATNYYYDNDGKLMVRVFSDEHKYVIDAHGNPQEEIIESATPEDRYVEGDYMPDATEDDMSKDILKILIGEEEE